MAGARALWVANGMKKEMIGKPIVAIVNSIELRRVAGITDGVLRCMAIRLDGVEEAAEVAPAAEEPAAE